MESSGECMINDTALTNPEGGSCMPGLTLGSYQVQGGRGQELDMKWQGKPYDSVVDMTLALSSICVTDLTCSSIIIIIIVINLFIFIFHLYI